MPGSNTTLLRVVLAVVTVSAVFPSTLWACPFCSAVEGDTLLSEVDRAKSVVLGTLVRQPSKSAHGERRRQAGFAIVNVARAEADLDPSAVIEARLTISAPVGSRHLLLNMPPGLETWQRRDISPQRWEFVTAAARLPAMRSNMSLRDRAHRLAFCLPYLASDSDALARSAYAEFAAAPYQAVKALAPYLDNEQLKLWIADDERSSRERSLMFTLLGVCGSELDVAFVTDAFEDGLEHKKATELASIIAAWLNIAGSEGLDEIDRRLLMPLDVPATRRRAAVEALRFHANVDGSVIERSRLLASARLLLAHPRAADLIICDLAEWEDWKSLETILGLWSEHGAECAWLNQPILNYLKACPLPTATSALAAISRPDPGQ